MSDLVVNEAELLYAPELRASGRWMNRSADGKIPIDPAAGRPISFKDSKNWALYSKLRDPRRACLVIDLPFVGVDLDWKNKDGSENPAKKRRAYELIERHFPPTYTEWSVSKLGLHLWYTCDEHAKLPDQVAGEFEVYARGRQFAMTGEVWPRAIRQVTRLTLAAALEIFRLANPVEVKTSKIATGEPGYWDEAALLAILEAFRKHVPNFWFKPCRHGYAVPCPGELGWPDGAKHSSKRLMQNSLIWVGNGHRRWECFHAHCAAKTTLDWLKFYDPLQVLFSHDEWETSEMRRLGLDGGAL